MSIVGGLLRSAGLGTVSDLLEAQGLMKAGGGLFDSRAVPSVAPEMFIGEAGVRNLGEAGALDSEAVLKTFKQAETDRGVMNQQEWNDMYGSMGLAYDDPANKAMFEISDRNVDFKKGIDIQKLSDKDYFGFDEIFQAETLKKAFPEISDVKILMKDNPNDSAVASFDPENNLIQFNRKSPGWRKEDALGTTLHEIQHYVQQREMLTGGESFKGTLKKNPLFADTYGMLEEKVNQSIPAVMNFLKKNPKSGFDLQEILDATQALKKPSGAPVDKSLEKIFKSKDKAQKFIDKVSELDKNGEYKYPELNDILFLKDINSAAYNTAMGDYMRVAGETFARQTDQRRLLSPEERMANPAMKAIDEDRVNKLYKINTENLTPSTTPYPAQQAAMPGQEFTDPFALQVPQSTIQGI